VTTGVGEQPAGPPFWQDPHQHDAVGDGGVIGPQFVNTIRSWQREDDPPPSLGLAVSRHLVGRQTRQATDPLRSQREFAAPDAGLAYKAHHRIDFEEIRTVGHGKLCPLRSEEVSLGNLVVYTSMLIQGRPLSCNEVIV
jgi:hypothetical protein